MKYNQINKYETIDYILKNYGKISIKNIANDLGASVSSIVRYAKHNNLKSKLGPKRTISVNENFFEFPSLINSYWAGFIAADGNISSEKKFLRIELSMKDIEHLERFKKDVEYEGDIKISKKKDDLRFLKKNNEHCYITVCSKKIAEDLKNNFNIVPNKTKILEPPLSLNRDNSLAFIKGYIDGDGSIYINKKNKHGQDRGVLTIIGRYEFVLWCKKVIDENCASIDESKVAKKILNNWDNFSTYSITKIDKFLEICEIFTNLNTPFLYRKWDNFLIIKNRESDKYSEKWFDENKFNEKGISRVRNKNAWQVRLYKDKKLIYYKYHRDKNEAIFDCLKARKEYGL